MNRQILVMFALAGLIVAAGLVVFTIAPASAGAIVVQPLTNAEAALYLSEPGPTGFEACGLFNSAGWGEQVVQFRDFPECADYLPDVVVACQDNGEWTENSISDVTYEEKEDSSFGPELSLIIQQHGVCGIFPAFPDLFEDLFIFGRPENLTLAELPVFVFYFDVDFDDPDFDFDAFDSFDAFEGSDEVSAYAVFTMNPERIDWDALTEGAYIIVRGDEVEWGDVQDEVPGLDISGIADGNYPEIMFEVVEDEADVVVLPLPLLPE